MGVKIKFAKEVLSWSLRSNRSSIIGHITDLIGAPYFAVNEKYWVWKGTHPVALVAHIDTVPEMRKKGFPPQLAITAVGGDIINQKNTGLGADDRAGIATIVSSLMDGYRPWVIICDGEERGGIGANALVKEISPEHFLEMTTEISAMIEMDRRGHNDVVYYSMDMTEDSAEPWRKILEEDAKFSHEIGSFSDISILAPAFQIAAANISIGYYHEHTSKEYLNIYQWMNTTERLFNILEATSELVQIPYTEKKYSSMYGKWYGGSGMYGGLPADDELEELMAASKHDAALKKDLKPYMDAMAKAYSSPRDFGYAEKALRNF